jgi:hypothetical protein
VRSSIPASCPDRSSYLSYSFAIGPLCRSFVTSIAFARFILHDELVPAFTAANLMGRELGNSLPWPRDKLTER